jgi:ADP-heptose:LPS heptosyltransferase
MTSWRECKNILCVRPDNMGDLLMSAPAITALKKTFNCSITVLTSSLAKGIAPYIPAIDHVMVWDVPWVKGTEHSGARTCLELVDQLKHKNFDAAVIFTVFSQSPLPTALLLSMANIPNRLAYCRENPYHLLSHWVPEEEPYTRIRHQVKRDLDLVAVIGARTDHDRISIRYPENQEPVVMKKLTEAGVDPSRPWLILHPGVSEAKREYPAGLWIEAAKKIVSDLHHQVLITGVSTERALAEKIRKGIGKEAYALAGALSLEEFIALIKLAPLLISVNTGSIHLAAALQTKVIVLYALTNPQHTPWKSIGRVLPFSVPESLESRNEVLRYVQKRFFNKRIEPVDPATICDTAYDLLVNKKQLIIPELVFPSQDEGF